MMPPLVQTFNDREEWLDARSVGIGASESPAVLGVSPYKSAFQLYHEKLGLVEVSQGEQEHLEWGKVLERPIAQRYERETKRPVLFDASPYVLRRHPDMAFLLATLDARVATAPEGCAGTGVLEIKNASSYVGQRWREPQEPPIEFVVQLQHQMLVTGDTWGSIAALIGGVFFVWADLRRDDDFCALLVEQCEDFMRRLHDRRPPTPDGSERTREVLKKLFPRDEPITVPLGPDAIGLAQTIAGAREVIKLTEQTKNEAEAQIKMLMGAATLGALPDGSCFTLKSQTRKEYTVRESTFRVLRFVAPKHQRQTRLAGRPVPLELTAGQEDALGDGDTDEALV